MMPVVQMPDGALVDMPDEPTPQQLAELRLLVSPSAVALTTAAPAANAPKRSMGDEFMRQLGLTARIPAHIATGTVGVAADAASGLYNTVADKAGMGGPRFNKVTPSINRILDSVLPTPETPTEHAVQSMGSLFGGPADVGGRVAQKAVGATSHIPGIPTSKMAQPAWDAPQQKSGPGIPDALAQASRDVLQHSKFRHLLGGLDKANPLMLAGLGYMAAGPLGMGAAALPTVAKALTKPTPAKLPEPPLRLPNGRFTTAAKLAKHEPLLGPPLSPLQEQFGIGGMPSLFSLGEQ